MGKTKIYSSRNFKNDIELRIVQLEINSILVGEQILKMFSVLSVLKSNGKQMMKKKKKTIKYLQNFRCL